jgi:hypothetical protein
MTDTTHDHINHWLTSLGEQISEGTVDLADPATVDDLTRELLGCIFTLWGGAR